MSKISNLTAREVLDSRGDFTIETEIILSDGSIGKFIVPSGKSKGKKEAVAIFDEKNNTCQKAVENVNTIIKKELINCETSDQRKLDSHLITLDGTEDKSNLGANAILSVSMANLIAHANSANQQLFEYMGGYRKMPTPYINIINGGEHADNSIVLQEFMIVPINFATFKESIRAASKVFRNLKLLLKNDNLSTNVGDEGGFAPNLNADIDALNLIVKAIEKSNFTPGKELGIAIDAAANSFYDDKSGRYQIFNKSLTSFEIIEEYQNLISQYPIISIEDPLYENDKIGWKEMTKRLSNKIQIVGDDIFSTNAKTFESGIKNKIANSILIKLNQIGTFTETKLTIDKSKLHNYSSIVSHRSGDSEDCSIAHLSMLSGKIKSGSLCRSERTAKYNELLRIEEYILEN